MKIYVCGLLLLLPTYSFADTSHLAEEMMAVFGTNSLENRMLVEEKKHKKIKQFGFHASNKKKRTKKQNEIWIQQVLKDVFNILPFQSDVNLGSNSNTDVYVELNAQKLWKITPDFNLSAEQTFRYGAESKSYSETNFNFTQKQSKQAVASNDFSIIKTYESEITWDDKLYRQQDFANKNRLSYGVYSSGTYNKENKNIDIQSWGPYFAWRLPIWRDWVYLENELSYYKDASAVEGYSFSVGVKLEATF